MRSPQTSLVIPFPKTAEAGQRRLKRAVKDLVAENDRQAEVVAHFQDKMKVLAAEIEGLRETCQNYKRSADRLDIKPLQRKIKRLSQVLVDAE